MLCACLTGAHARSKHTHAENELVTLSGPHPKSPNPPNASKAAWEWSELRAEPACVHTYCKHPNAGTHLEHPTQQCGSHTHHTVLDPVFVPVVPVASDPLRAGVTATLPFGGSARGCGATPLGGTYRLPLWKTPPVRGSCACCGLRTEAEPAAAVVAAPVCVRERDVWSSISLRDHLHGL